jgi:ketosteroid isomerase-like protein
VPQTKTELVRQAFEAFNERNLEVGLEVMSPNVEFHAPTSELANEGAPYVGHDGIRKYYSDVERIWEELEVVPSEFRELNDHVLVFGRVYGRGAGGYVQDSPAQWVFTIRNGTIACVKVFTNRSAALAELGLEE